MMQTMKRAGGQKLTDDEKEDTESDTVGCRRLETDLEPVRRVGRRKHEHQVWPSRVLRLT